MSRMAPVDRVFSPPTPRRVRGADLDLAVYECGLGGAPTIVLVHGYPDNHTVWDGVAAALSERFHVVTYDVRGAGASDTPAGREGYRIENLAADLEAVIEATSAGRPAHVVGHDWGSIQAWQAVTDERIGRRIASFTSLSGPCLDHVGHWLQESLSAGAYSRVLRQALRSWYVGFFQIPRLPERIWHAGLARTWPRMLARTEGVKDASPVRTDDGVHGLELYRANVPARLFAPQMRSTKVPVWRRSPRAGIWFPSRCPSPGAPSGGHHGYPYVRSKVVTGWCAPRPPAWRVGSRSSRGRSLRLHDGGSTALVGSTPLMA